MNDPADIAFVYSHPERDRCAYHVDTVVDEIVLCFLAFVGAEPGMIGDCTDAIFGQFFDQRLRTVAAHAVDDAALPVVSVDEMDNRSDLFLFTQSATDSERQVRAVERRDECFRITQFQLIQDVRPGDFVCRSRQGDDRYFREILFQNGQLGIFGTEIMPPMRDTMRFVDSDQRNVDAGQEPVQFTYDPFGRDVEQFHFSLYAELPYPVAFFLRHHAVECCRGDAVGDQSFDLVLHQSDKGRHYDGSSRHIDRRKLEADRFSATRRHQDQRIFFLQDALYDFGL